MPDPDDATRYLYFCRHDGLGFQYFALSWLLGIAEGRDCTVLVDWRSLSFVRSRRQSFTSEALHRYFRLRHPRLIYDPAEIERILKDEAAQVTGAQFGRFTGPVQRSASDIPFRMIKSIAEAHDIRPRWLGPYIELAKPLQEIHDRYVERVSRAVGVHARLGNGERLKNPAMQARMDIPFEAFFEAMDTHPDCDFLLCTDTPAFLQASLDRYGDRVMVIPRAMPPEGVGPGHLAMEGGASVGSDGLQLLGDAMLDMLLLGECGSLICNNSAFTYHARECRGVPTQLIFDEPSTYAIGWQLP